MPVADLSYNLCVLILHCSISSLMSALNLFGVFALRDGCCSKSGKSYYCFYNTALQCSSGTALPAEMRIYSPMNDMAVEDDTVVFAHCCAYLLYSEILLNVSHIFPFPGDPSSHEYDENLPDFCSPYVSGLGYVPFRHKVLSDNRSKAFNVVCSEYVHDKKQTSTIQYIFSVLFVNFDNVPLDVYMMLRRLGGTILQCLM